MTGKRIATGLAAAVALLTVPQAAAAAPEWEFGLMEESTVRNCAWMPEPGINAAAGILVDKADLPRTGEVFYVRGVAARVGSGCDTPMQVHAEFVLPTGVSTAISPSTPVKCRLWDFTADTYSPLDGCPTEAWTGMHGPAFDRVTPGGPTESTPWDVPYAHAIVIDVPVRSSRRLAGSGGGTPSCGRLDGRPPCPPEKAGDHVQFAAWVIDGFDGPWLVPDMPLFVEGAQGAGGAGSLLTAPPSAVRVKALRKGRLRVPVQVPAAGATVVATLKVAGRTVAKGRLRRAAAGTATVRLKATRAGRKRLGRLSRPATGRLTVRATTRGGGRTVATARLKVRPA